MRADDASSRVEDMLSCWGCRLPDCRRGLVVVVVVAVVAS